VCGAVLQLHVAAIDMDLAMEIALYANMIQSISLCPTVNGVAVAHAGLVHGPWINHRRATD
jgi:hypothetical protein